MGRYHGLTEGTDGDIYTLQGMQVVQFTFKHGRYSIKEKIKLSIIEEFEKWLILSRLRNLLFSDGKLYITDSGLHKLLIVDMRTGHQTALGYMGEGIGQFKNPAGIISDNAGNLLLADQGNNRILVCNSFGNWIKIGAHMEENLEQPCGINLHGDDVMVACRGGVVRYQLNSK